MSEYVVVACERYSEYRRNEPSYGIVVARGYTSRRSAELAALRFAEQDRDYTFDAYTARFAEANFTAPLSPQEHRS